MEATDQRVEFIWLPFEEELPEIHSVLSESKEQRNFSQFKPITSLKSYLAKLLNLLIHTCDFQQKIVFDNSEKDNPENKSKTPYSMFYTEYLFKVCCMIESERKFNFNFGDIKSYKKIINAFCAKRHGIYCPELWLSINTSVFIENDLRTVNHFMEVKSFSLGSLVKLNKFVEHFSSEYSLDSCNYKITQVKVKFLHDEQLLHVYFVVGNAKVSLKKRSAKSHRMHRLVIPYSSFHTILLCNDENFTAYFRLYKSPMLSHVEQDEEAENYISYLDLKPNSNWFRTVNLFEGCSRNIGKEFSMNYVLRLKFCHEDYEVFKILLHHKSVQIYFTPMFVTSSTNVHPFEISDFECDYGFRCLLTHSHEALDQLMSKEEMTEFRKFVTIKCNENSKALSSAFHIIHSAISQCNVVILNYSLKILFERVLGSVPFLNIDGTGNNPNHNLLLVKRAFIIPTHVRLLPPQPILQSRALRNCDPNFSLRIVIRDVNSEPINFSFYGFSIERKKLLKKFFEVYYKETMLKGIKIGNRCYEYVGSSTSQLRSHGLWFYAKDDGKTADGKIKTAKDLRKDFGNMKKIKQVPKYMARMGQTFSQAMGNIIVPQKYTNINNPEDDVTGGIKQYLSEEDLEEGRGKYLKPVAEGQGAMNQEPYTFSDGIGRMSMEIAEEVYKNLEVEESRPAAMQIRYAGCKGMLVVDPTLKVKKILFRKSMKKFDSDSDSLEIIKFSEKRSASLNRPLITILEQLGVSKEVFIKLQKDMIQNHIKSMFHEAEACDFLNRNSHLRFDFIGMHKVGIRFTEDPLFRSIIYALFRKLLDLLKTKASIEIPVNKGRAMFGVLDETSTLEYGQVFVQYSDWITDEPKIVKGTIVVTKNPCMHPGDVRKFQAVDVEALHHIRDCIVFPAKGPRPHPDEMAGSDLDGDEYHVMWIEDFFFHRDNVDAMHFAMPKDHSKDLERDIEVSDELDHLCDYIVNDNVGLIANAHLVFADKEKEGIFGINCIRLAKKYAIALDFAKSGIPATRNKSDRVFNYPDFMEKVGEKKTYVSKKALGVLYRNCKCLEMGLETSNNEVEYKVDSDLIWENWENYKKSALRMYKRYCEQIEYLINAYSFNNEGELLAGAIINPPKYYEQRHDLENLKVLLEYEVNKLFRDLEKKFFNEFGGKPVDKNYTEKMYQKASAWYAVTYKMPGKKGCYFGLPWAVAGVLKKMKSEKYINKGSKTANRKSLLEEIVDGSLSKYIPIMSEDTETCIIYKNRLEILSVALKVLIRWLKSQRDFFMIPDFKAFEKIVTKEFESISSILLSCDVEYIEQLKRTNNLKKAISPCYYIIETMLSIANIKTTNLKISFTNVQQELGLLSWITLIKLACTYNPQYLNIADKDGNYASSIFYMPQDNVISTFKVNLFEQKNCSHPFSLKLLHKPDKVTEYLKLETKLKNVDFRFDIGRDKERVAIFTVMGSRYAIEKLKDLIILDDFFRYVVEEKSLSTART